MHKLLTDFIVTMNRIAEGVRSVVVSVVEMIRQVGEWARSWLSNGPRLLWQWRRSQDAAVAAVDREIVRGASAELKLRRAPELLEDAQQEGWVVFLQSMADPHPLDPRRAGSRGATRALGSFDRRRRSNGLPVRWATLTNLDLVADNGGSLLMATVDLRGLRKLR